MSSVEIHSELNATNRDNLAAYDKGQRYRFQEQCFLNFWKAEIFKQLKTYNQDGFVGRRRRENAGGRSNPWSETPSLNQINGKLVGSNVYTYEHINVIDAHEPAKMVSMFSQKDGADLFFRLDSSILSQLRPVVELYKIFPQIDTVNQTDAEAISPNTIAYKVPMPLGENIKPGDENGGSVYEWPMATIEELFHEQNVLGNAMLTDLSFRFAGKNIALLNTVEDVSFTLAFSSFNLFKHKFETTAFGGPENKTEKELTWSYQDLISYSTKYLQKEGQADVPIESGVIQNSLSCYKTAESFVGGVKGNPIVYAKPNQDHFEIQMVVRYDPDDIDWDMAAYANNENTGRLKFNEEEQEAIRSFLRNSAVILRLQFVAHTIRYNSKSSGADPELLIDFEYKAFIESSFNSPDLDLFKLPHEEGRELMSWETKLYQARKLLKAVQRDKLTLNAVFGAKGQLNTNLNNQYQSLRNSLDAAAGSSEDALQWLIWNPASPGAGRKSLASMVGLIPIEKDLKTSEQKDAIDQSDQPKKQVRPFMRTVRRGLKYDPENLETALGSTGNADKVFTELINKITAYIKTLRRTYIQEKYQNLFEALYAQERVYSVPVETEDIGWNTSGEKEVKSEGEMAEHRQGKLDNSAAIKLSPGTVKIVRTDDGQEPGAADPLKQVVDKFENLNMKKMDTSMSHQMDTLAQQIQSELGEPSFSEPTHDGEGDVIYFTNLGDIIDTAISIASFPDYGLYKRRIGLLLGPLLEQDNSGTHDEQSYVFNLAWVPVSLKTLMGFFAVKVIASGKERYLLNDFIKDLIKDLILPALGSRCEADAQEGNHQVGTVTFTTEMQDRGANEYIPPFFPQHSGTDPLDYPRGGGAHYFVTRNQKVWQPPTEQGSNKNQPIPWGDGSIKKLTEVSPNAPIENQFHYMFIYINNISPINLKPENEKENIRAGIYYLHLGQVPSIVKEATFRKENIPYVREARAMGQLTRTGGIALRDVYRFQCSMYGNNIFQPGMLFFVDPTKDGSPNYEDWKELGLVGFYRTVSVDHLINAGMSPVHETRIDAVWETFGECPGGEGLINTEFRTIWFRTEGHEKTAAGTNIRAAV